MGPYQNPSVAKSVVRSAFLAKNNYILSSILKHKFLQDKALLNKPADERTDREKQYLYRIIGGLKCFKRYPNVRLL